MRIPAPGRLVDIGGRRLHVQERGGSGPIVVFEAGIAASSLSWSLVQDPVAEFARTISYDRAGFGWSDAAPLNSTAKDAAEDLNRALMAAGVNERVILAGHSFGGLIARLFEQMYPERVAGMVLVDPVVRREWREADGAKLAMLGRGVSLSRRGATLARLGIVGAALRLLTGGSQRIPKLLAKASAGTAAGVTDRLVGEVRKMPKHLWPAIAQHWSQSQSFEAMARNLEKLPVSSGQLEEGRAIGDIPVRILTARAKNPEHEADAALAGGGRCVVLPHCGHWVQLDDPETVVSAIREVAGLVS